MAQQLPTWLITNTDYELSDINARCCIVNPRRKGVCTMALAPWAPFTELDRLRDDMDRLFNKFFGNSEFPARKDQEPVLDTRGWTLPVDMVDRPEEIFVRAMVPGVKKKDISVFVSDGTLTISGEQKGDTEVKEEDRYYSEHHYGKFHRSINLPTAVDGDFKKQLLKIITDENQ